MHETQRAIHWTVAVAKRTMSSRSERDHGPALLRPILIGCFAWALVACGGGDAPVGSSGSTGSTGSGGSSGSSGSGGSGGGLPPLPELTCDTVVADADCDMNSQPIVFIHGTFGSATEVSTVAQLFGSNGYCQDRFVAVEYNSLGGNPATQLAALVDKVLADTGFTQVVLAGHSQGTGHACTYLSDPMRAAKVSHYLNLSGGCDGYGVPTLSLSSQNDGVSGTAGPVHSSGPNVTQVTLENEDHVAIAGSKNAFIAIYNYLMGQMPAVTTVECGQDPVVLDGKVTSFGDNVPGANATVDFFEIEALVDSPWDRPAPAKTLTTDADGHFRIELKRNTLYEARVTGSDGTLLGFGYQGPLRRSNYIARFVTPSKNPLVAAQSTDKVIRGPNHVGFVGRYVAGAFRQDWNNSLKIDGQEVLTADNAPQRPSVVGFFMFDANQNGQSELGAVFGPSTFLVGTDVFVDATTPRWLTIEWTNEENRSAVMRVPNWPSDRNLASINLPHP